MERIGMLLLLVASLGALSGCEYGDTIAAGGDTSVKPNPAQSVVCNPFNAQNPALQGHGLTASLRYLTDTQPRYSAVMDNIGFGVLADTTLYLNDLNVPTRPFDKGFFTQAGSPIVNSSGNQLYEYFSIDSLSQLTLASGDTAGDYQMAVLADDGSIIEVQDSIAGYTELVNADGGHPTLMGCATRPIHMTDQTPLPIKIHYYQGPRFHIALVVLWRPWPTNPQDVNDPLCGQMGNSLFFDSTQTPSAPQQAYQDLISRGWKPVSPSNYLLPFDTGSNNPCVIPSAPQVSNFRIDVVTQFTAVASWNTDLAATSQVSYSLYPSNVYSTTVLDSTLTTNHSVVLTGLTNFGFYTVYGMSTANGIQTLTNTLNFRTLR